MKQSILLADEAQAELRTQNDRRYQPIQAFLYSTCKGDRAKARRQSEIDRGFYTDKYETWVFFNVVAVIILCAADAFFTLNIIAQGGTEANPVMAALLTYGDHTFMIVKMAVTTLCLLTAVVHINFRLYNIFSVKQILVVILALYLSLIGYELFLLSYI